jgi:hypothetical protein
MQAQAATASPATSEATLALVGPVAIGRAQAALKRFEDSIQSLLDNPLDASRVLEWTRLRTLDA